MILFPFQTEAAEQISQRFRDYSQDPLTITRRKNVPFYQNLSSITGSGKTPILADAMAKIRAALPVEPIVLWISKGKVVVLQTLTNLSSGGKYHHLVGDYDVKPLLDCTTQDVEDSKRGLLLVATVGKFNQKDKDAGDRRIFRVQLDIAESSLWESLRTRKDAQGKRRPFIIVYDEGHNLSDQQTRLLLELEPDALIAASATLKVPEALSTYINRFKSDKSWQDADFSTVVKSSEVVAAGLVKKHMLLGGYMTPMEVAIGEMLETMRQATQQAETLELDFRPKAIYVSTTNIKDDASQPFTLRQARPILIWRHLVEQENIDPSEIAVYCDLKFEKKLPPPAGFNLFSGGDNDYDRFMQGNYRHIIFNLSLQEGWDDPECGFAYIDKEMGAAGQVTQIIGRVLRQPGTKHYPSPLLNTAHFYIRTDAQGVFDEVLEGVKKDLTSVAPDITLTVYKSSKKGSKPLVNPKKALTVTIANKDSSEAKEPIREIVNDIFHFQADNPDTVGIGSKIQILQTIGSGKEASEEWVEVEHGNLVTARSIFLQELRKLTPDAEKLVDIEEAKFDALIEYNSKAAKYMKEQADKVAKAYQQHSRIVLDPLDDPYTVTPMYIDSASQILFNNALHSAYSGLNGFEEDFAKALDKKGTPWCRNPSPGGYEIPLLDGGRTKNFRPDFLVWLSKGKSEYVIAIDPKADMLILEDSGRKLLLIESVGGGPQVLVRLVTEGKWVDTNGSIQKESVSTGYTVWTLKQGRRDVIHCTTIAKAVDACLKI